MAYGDPSFHELGRQTQAWNTSQFCMFFTSLSAFLFLVILASRQKLDAPLTAGDYLVICTFAVCILVCCIYSVCAALYAKCRAFRDCSDSSDGQHRLPICCDGAKGTRAPQTVEWMLRADAAQARSMLDYTRAFYRNECCWKNVDETTGAINVYVSSDIRNLLPRMLVAEFPPERRLYYAPVVVFDVAVVRGPRAAVEKTSPQSIV